MTELLFVLTIIFVAYIIYVIINEQKQILMAAELREKTKQKASEAVTANRPVAEVKTTPVVQAAPKPKPQVATAEVATSTPAAVAKGNVRNPLTGEIASIASNYRFTKRWIKEALVAEGFLDKVYKNNELNAEAEALIKTALAKLEALDKYQVG
ncbi:hypothetical protein [Methylocucumis oryzae]|uniref:Uncharacterized protein n=1 Tax=Methylocucumis oryzae TaxID=1632867 RepID=A0A0F3IL95_9GAMM|nr:hypothetical protein [Methylocucumis oryzae]KJV07515.1 hypothetical protein VZ94_04295 [Methylocucumis oryzae]